MSGNIGNRIQNFQKSVWHLWYIMLLYYLRKAICDVCGSVGTGRRARLRILWSLRSCGFKSHLPQEKKRVKPYGLALFFYAEESLESKAQGLLAINGSSVGSVGKRSTGPFFACTFRCTLPPHPIFRIRLMVGKTNFSRIPTLLFLCVLFLCVLFLCILFFAFCFFVFCSLRLVPKVLFLHCKWLFQSVKLVFALFAEYI